MKPQRRFGSGDANDTDETAKLAPSSAAPRQRVPRAGAHSASRSGGGLLRAPLFLLMVAFFAVGIVYHVYQFSLSMPQYVPLREPFYNKTMVEFSTKFGPFTLELFPEHAPKSVANFLKLVEKGYYADKAGFYRNEPGFLLQGGAFLFDKPPPFANVPVEYSLPSTERMVVVARGQKPDSGNAEFAIMLTDNSIMNRPEGSSPGYTAFARVVRGWHTIQYISKRLREGFLTKDDVDRQVLFDKVQLVEHLTNDNAEAKRRIEELMYGIETKHAITIVSELDCPQTRELQTLFHDLKAMTRIEEIGYSTAHPYEHEAMQAIAGTAMLPLVYVNQKLVGGYDEIKRLEQTKSLAKMLEKAGALAEGVAMDAIQRYPLVVFSKSYCPYCKKAKGLLANLGATPQVFELDLRDDGAAIQDFLFGYTGQATVPNVFIKGKSIGGSDKTAEMHKSGELLARLKSAGAIRG